MTHPTLKDVQQAKTLLTGHVLETPMLYSPYLSRAYGADIFLKIENFQETGSFKERGAYVKLKSLPPETLQRGVIAVSAGNHAQAVAFHAYNLQSSATIIMPLFTPPTKVRNTEKWGARIILAGQTLDEAQKLAQEIALKENLTFIHPYDDKAIIAGQGTIGLEMLEACPDLEVLLIPIGGGGLCSGIAVAAKSINPSLKIYGVEVEGYASMAQALYGRSEREPTDTTLAEGIAVKIPGKLPQAILKTLLDDILIVQEEAVEHAVDLLARKQNVVAEGAGAAGLAALVRNPSLFSKKKVGIVVSGGNIDARLISAIMMRGQIHEGRVTILRIEVRDTPGVLAQISKIIADHQGNILEVHHQRLVYEIPIKMAELDIMVEARGKDHMTMIIKALEAAGFSVSTLASGLDVNGLCG